MRRKNVSKALFCGNIALYYFATKFCRLMETVRLCCAACSASDSWQKTLYYYIKIK